VKHSRWLLLFVLGCADCNPEETRISAPRVYTWEEWPLRMELSANLTPCQNAGIRAGITYWESLAKRKLIVVREVPENTLSVSGIVPKGVIGVVRAPMFKPETIDQVEWTPLLKEGKNVGLLHSAEMRVQGCSLRAFAHEVGHVLGLEHAQGPRLLMTEAHDPDAWEITDAELMAVVAP